MSNDSWKGCTDDDDEKDSIHHPQASPLIDDSIHCLEADRYYPLTTGEPYLEEYHGTENESDNDPFNYSSSPLTARHFPPSSSSSSLSTTSTDASNDNSMQLSKKSTRDDSSSSSSKLHHKEETDDVMIDSRQSSSSNITTTHQQCTNEPSQDINKAEKREQVNSNISQCDTTKKRLHPFVHWAQSSIAFTLRVDLVEAKEVSVIISEDQLSLTFSAKGKGAHGLQEYYFSLVFFDCIEKELLDCSTFDWFVLIKLEKSRIQWWPRLTAQSIKLPWLRVDFDRWHDHESSGASDQEDDEEQAIETSRREFHELQEQLKQTQEKQSAKYQEKNLDNTNSSSSTKKNFDIFNPFNKKRNIGKKVSTFSNTTSNMRSDTKKDNTSSSDHSKKNSKHGLDYKKVYLFLYNIAMFIMYTTVVLVLGMKTVTGTVKDDTVKGAAFIIKLLTYTQLMETVHPILGLVPGGPMMPFTQCFGRLLVNHFLSEPAIRTDAAPYANYLFIVWSTIEIFRYSFYALRILKLDVYLITWCRYSLFLPLYPMGGFCESMVILSTIKLFEKTGQYSLSLPNSANISFNLPIALRVYIYLLLGPTIYYLMSYMWRQRCKQLKP